MEKIHLIKTPFWCKKSNLSENCKSKKFQAANMSHIQISNTLVGYCWCVVKPFIAVLMLYSSGGVVLWGVPYIG